MESKYNRDAVQSIDPWLSHKGISVGSALYLTQDENQKIDGLKSSKESTMGHEFRHAYDHDQGLMKGEKEEYVVGERHKDPREIRAVNFENRIRHRSRLPIRNTYGKPIDKNLLDNPAKSHKKKP